MKVFLLLLVVVAVLHSSSTASYKPRAEKKKMVCYFGSWAVYRPGNGKFDVENIDPFICTHIVYGFAGLQSYDSTIVSLDPWNDLYENWGKGAFERFTGLKKRNPQLKALLAIGGWNEGSEKYSQMASDPAKRAKFVQSVVNFLPKYGFDGLDFDWEYPANRGGIPADKQNFIHMIRELKEAFAPKGLMLTAAVSAGKGTIDSAYDVPAMSSILDQIHIMSYDYHGAWETFTGHNSPLYGNPSIDLGDNIYFNMNYSVHYWLSQGAPASKLCLGMGLYGRGFTLNSATNNGFYAPANQPIPAGPYTRENGFWGYNEICEKFKTEGGWIVVNDAKYAVPYAYKSNLWIGYDDTASLARKAQFVNDMGLGGAMVWSLETDDFRGFCSGTPFILIKSITNTMNGAAPPPDPTTSTTSTTTTTTRTTTTTPTTTTAKVTSPISTTSNAQHTTTTQGIQTSTNCIPQPSTTALWTTQGTTIAAGTTTVGGPFKCTSEGTFADPTDCAKFFQCVRDATGWRLYSFVCPPRTVFNPKASVCDYPSQVPGCENYIG